MTEKPLSGVTNKVCKYVCNIQLELKSVHLSDQGKKIIGKQLKKHIRQGSFHFTLLHLYALTTTWQFFRNWDNSKMKMLWHVISSVKSRQQNSLEPSISWMLSFLYSCPLARPFRREQQISLISSPSLATLLNHWHPLHPHAPGNIIPLKFQSALMRPVRHGTLWLAVAKKPYSPENWNLVKRDLNKLSFIWDQTRKNTFYLRFFTNFWKQQFSSRHGF